MINNNKLQVLVLALASVAGLVLVQCATNPIPRPTMPPLKSTSVSPLKSASPLVVTSPVTPSCDTWDQVRPQLGETLCAKGNVIKSYNIGNDFIIEFSSASDSIYGVAHNYFYPGIDGNYVCMRGEVKQDSKGRFYLQVDLPGQVDPCSP